MPYFQTNAPKTQGVNKQVLPGDDGRHAYPAQPPVKLILAPRYWGVPWPWGAPNNGWFIMGNQRKTPKMDGL